MAAYKIIVRSIFTLSVMFTACSEDIKPKAYEASMIFTGENSKTWKLTQLSSRNLDTDEEYIYSLGSCTRDDRYTFYANDERLYEVSNGNFPCSGDEDDLLVSYTWSYNNANASLSMVVPHIFGYFFIPFTVKYVDDDEMELEIFVNVEGTESYALLFEAVGEN